MSLPLIAYISARRIGHQGWETIMHVSYAKKKGKRIIIFMSPEVVNNSFNSLSANNVRFIQLPHCFLFFERLLHIINIFIKSMTKKFNNDLSRFPYQKVLAMKKINISILKTSNPGELVSPFRFNSDALGSFFDKITLLLPQIHSKAFYKYSHDDYFNYKLPISYFKPLKIRGQFYKLGESLLKALDIPSNSWFVCLHIRESSYLGDKGREWKNQEISNYIEAVKYITDLGGYVIRMGDPSMKTFPLMDKVIDYAHSNYRSGFTDLYLCSKARFFCGNSSGIRQLPQIFKTPILSVGVYPLTGFDLFDNTLVIFKKVFSKKKGEYLSLREILNDPMLCFRYTDEEYEKAHLQIVKNTSAEILDATKEMIKMISDGTLHKWKPKQRLFQKVLKQKLNGSDFINGHGNTIFYPNAICRIGARYYDDNF